MTIDEAFAVLSAPNDLTAEQGAALETLYAALYPVIYSGDVMRVDFSKCLKDARRKDVIIQTEPGKPPEPFLMMNAVCQALQEVGEEGDSMALKRRRANLANRIFDAGGVVDLNSDDADLIRRQVDKAWPNALFFAQIDAVLAAAEKAAETN